MSSETPTRPIATLTRLLFVTMMALTIAFLTRQMMLLWVLDTDGLSTMSRTTPYWDFSNFWGGGRVALAGNLAPLFDVTLFRQQLATLLSAPISSGEWAYPPTMLLVGVPLALLPAGAAYVVWTIGTIALFALALFTIPMSPLVRALALVSPAVAVNVILGQNGALTGALLFAGLALADRRPIASGLLIGCLVIKPHLAVLVPVGFVAAGNWRAFSAAAISAVALSAISAFLFGFSAWTGFLDVTRPMMTAMMEAAFGQGYQANFVTIFMLARALGAGLLTAYGAQLLALALAVIATWRLWRNPLSDRPMRLAATIGLTFLAVPYGYSYDLVPLEAAAAIVMCRMPVTACTVAAFAAWIWPMLANAVSQRFGLPLAPLPILLLTACCLVLAKRPPFAGVPAEAGGNDGFARI